MQGFPSRCRNKIGLYIFRYVSKRIKEMECQCWKASRCLQHAGILYACSLNQNLIWWSKNFVCFWFPTFHNVMVVLLVDRSDLRQCNFLVPVRSSCGCGLICGSALSESGTHEMEFSILNAIGISTPPNQTGYKTVFLHMPPLLRSAPPNNKFVNQGFSGISGPALLRFPCWWFRTPGNSPALIWLHRNNPSQNRNSGIHRLIAEFSRIYFHKPPPAHFAQP